ncbi:L-ascorbate peroxidase, cytosolic-like protein, partial [Tanacetum coccineum]
MACYTKHIYTTRQVVSDGGLRSEIWERLYAEMAQSIGRFVLHVIALKAKTQSREEISILAKSETMGKMYPVVTEEYRMALEAAKPKLKAFLIESGCAPLMLRLAFHTAGTFDVKTKTGGPF